MTYNTAGTYAATLTVTNASGTSTRTTAAVVTVST
ncbi:MAG: PKD domain-containing protein [Hymenobacter sp.]